MHFGFCIQHGIIHTYIEDLSTTLNLFKGNGKRFFVFFFPDKSGKFFRTTDIGSFTYVNKIAAFINSERF